MSSVRYYVWITKNCDIMCGVKKKAKKPKKPKFSFTHYTDTYL
jgi:hypothetical protein